MAPIRMNNPPAAADVDGRDLPAETTVIVPMTERRPAFTTKSTDESYEAFATRLRVLAGLPT